jgi:hypothetical protein
MKMLTTVYDYVDALAELQTVAPETHVAGGAVRDTLLKKPLHDVDVFMDDEHVEEAAKVLRSRLGFVKVGEWKQYLGFSDLAILRVAKFEKAEETIPLCVIDLKSQYASPEANIARFDFGVGMAAFNGESILRTLEFDADVEAKTFTLCRADNSHQYAYSMSRYKKITAGRYSGWELSILNEFKQFAMEYEFGRRWYVDAYKQWFGGQNVLRPKERVVA